MPVVIILTLRYIPTNTHTRESGKNHYTQKNSFSKCFGKKLSHGIQKYKSNIVQMIFWIALHVDFFFFFTLLKHKRLAPNVILNVFFYLVTHVK